MKATTEAITYDQWEEKYKPVQNHLTKDRPFDNTMFETHGDEFIHVRKQWNSGTVWTLVEGEDDTMYIIPGCRWVNRMGYFITEVACDLDDLESILVD